VPDNPRAITLATRRARAKALRHFSLGAWRRGRAAATVPAVKDLGFTVVGVLGLALGLGLVFHWVYPLVEPSGELATLFVFVALALKLVLGKLWSWRRGAAGAPPATEKQP
jgi:hypothetical protein